MNKGTAKALQQRGTAATAAGDVAHRDSPASSRGGDTLYELGVRFAMDDFGTGYSSLGYLLSFPFHRIKIDRSFIVGLTDKDEARAIVRATVDLARSLGMRVTAEGVETAQQLQAVRTLGCTEMQGYLVSPPRPAAEILQLLPSSSEPADSSTAVSAGRKNGQMCQVRPDLGCNHGMTASECDVLKDTVAGETTEEFSPPSQ